MPDPNVFTDQSWDANYPDVPDDLLPGAVAYAWQVWHGKGRSGLLAQLNAIRFQTPEGQAGRPGDAVGVSAATWNGWLLKALGVRDKKGRALGTTPSAASRARIAQVVAGLRIEAHQPLPTRAFVVACIVWAGYQNGRGRVDEPVLSEIRATTLDDLVLDRSSRAWAAGDFWQAAQHFCEALFARYGEIIDLYGTTELVFKP